MSWRLFRIELQGGEIDLNWSWVKWDKFELNLISLKLRGVKLNWAEVKCIEIELSLSEVCQNWVELMWSVLKLNWGLIGCNPGRASSEFLELRDEGIVSANLHRFSTGTIGGKITIDNYFNSNDLQSFSPKIKLQN